jgi:hypothetical protein
MSTTEDPPKAKLEEAETGEEQEDSEGNAEEPPSERPSATKLERTERVSLPPKSGFRKSLAIAVGVLLAVIAAIFIIRRVREEPQAASPVAAPSALDAIPEGAFLVATADLRVLRQEPLTAPFLSGDRDVAGLGPMRTACGFDPLSLVDELAIGIPDSPDDDFGVVALGRLTAEPIAECARKMITARGGTPVTADLGRFKSVRDAKNASSGEIAVAPNGPLLFGGGAYLRAMMAAAEAPGGQARGSAHTGLRKVLVNHDTIQATIVLSPAQRKTIADELSKAKGEAPLGVGYIAGAGLGIRFAGNEARLLLVLRTDQPDQVAAVTELLAANLGSVAEGPAVRMIGAGEVLRRVQLETQGNDVRASVTVTGAEVADILEKANRLATLVNAMEAGTPVENQPQP